MPYEKKIAFGKIRWPSWKNENYGQQSICKAYTIIMFVWNFHACVTICKICPNFQTNTSHKKSSRVYHITTQYWNYLQVTRGSLSMYIWSFCGVHRRKYGYMENIQFHANSHKRKQILTSLFPVGGISLILELTSKINQCPPSF